MKIIIDFKNNVPNVSADNELASINDDEYYAMLTDAIQTLQSHLLAQYTIDESIENNG